MFSVGWTWWRNHGVMFCLHGSIVSTEGMLTQLSKCGKLTQCPASVSLGLSLSSSWGHITFPGIMGIIVLRHVCRAQGSLWVACSRLFRRVCRQWCGQSLVITVLQVDLTAQPLEASACSLFSQVALAPFQHTEWRMVRKAEASAAQVSWPLLVVQLSS